jgi:hypothetical protein
MMAISTIRSVAELEGGFVLAPERYDPRRAVSNGDAGATLSPIAALVRSVAQPGNKLGPCLVFDTSDAREGIIISRGVPQDGAAIGSAKKLIQAGDVIISRLRPYLRQVAYVDASIPRSNNAKLLCSTEFLVLRSADERSIAFLVPYLLSRRIQEILAAAQEGGHHPRFNDSTLMTLPVPESLIGGRERISADVEKSIRLYRQSEATIADAINVADAAGTK